MVIAVREEAIKSIQAARELDKDKKEGTEQGSSTEEKEEEKKPEDSKFIGNNHMYLKLDKRNSVLLLWDQGHGS